MTGAPSPGEQVPPRGLMPPGARAEPLLEIQPCKSLTRNGT